MSTTLTPYLSFDGTTREAFAFYEQALGGRIDAMMRYADMPAPAAPAEGCGPSAEGMGEAIMHACLTLPGGAMLFAGDAPPGRQHQGIQGVMLTLQYDTVAEAQAAFAALSQGGQVTMPLAPSFWAKTFGMLTDRFGLNWAINGESIPRDRTPAPESAR
ncbi:VOC family protein [Xylophilus rhododendri]|uniref:VOC family protein n=1 Tax=Xylophilus rhododendri TaxID=2697032 RepID=A0A857JAN8_9BURK|nr:VOC family protein [Xylophilus rhododendri]QHJ01075.1 VOC family protein [Xylophilus rhododendri]